jgi:acylphosphatase
MKSYRFFITGRVQGVFYRANVAKNAQSEGFSGYVRNLDDGRVEAAVSCRKEELENFKKILHIGSPASSVSSIEEHSIDEYFNGEFEVRY